MLIKFQYNDHILLHSICVPKIVQVTLARLLLRKSSLYYLSILPSFKIWYYMPTLIFSVIKDIEDICEDYIYIETKILYK